MGVCEVVLGMYETVLGQFVLDNEGAYEDVD